MSIRASEHPGISREPFDIPVRRYLDYDHDPMPVEVAAGDLFPGDLVQGGSFPLGSRITAAVNSPERDFRLWGVEGVLPTADDSHVIVDAGDAGQYLIPSDWPVTAHGAICTDCDMHPLDCDCGAECTALTGHLSGADHRWQECPSYHDDEED